MVANWCILLFISPNPSAKREYQSVPLSHECWIVIYSYSKCWLEPKITVATSWQVNQPWNITTTVLLSLQWRNYHAFLTGLQLLNSKIDLCLLCLTAVRALFAHYKAWNMPYKCSTLTMFMSMCYMQDFVGNLKKTSSVNFLAITSVSTKNIKNYITIICRGNWT